jgi:hypothetical protein
MEVSPVLDFLDDRVRLRTVMTFAQSDHEGGLLKALDDASVEIRTEALKGLRKRISNELVVDYPCTLENRQVPAAQDRAEIAVAVLLRFDANKTRSYFEEFVNSKDKTLSHLFEKAPGSIKA